MNRRLLRLTRAVRLPLALTILSGLLAGWLVIVQVSALSLSVERVFLGGGGLGLVWPAIRLILVVIVFRAGLAWGMEVSANTLAARLKNDLRSRLFAKLLELGPGYTRGEKTGELASSAVEGIEALDAYYSQYLPQMAIAALVPLSILVVAFPLDPLSGIVLLLTAPLIPVFMILIGKGAEALTKRQYDTLGRLSSHFLDSLQGLTTLKEFGRSRDRVRSIAESSERFRDVTLSVLRVTFLSALVLELVATVSTAVIAVEVGLRLLYGHLAFRQAFFLLLLAPEFYIPLRMLGLRFHAGMSGTTAARRIFEVLDLPVPLRPVSTPIQPGPPGEIRFEQVGFRYPGGGQAALVAVDLTIRRGEHLALVGPSGAGKSTLAALLLGFMEPTSGSLRVDGRDRREVPLEDWRSRLAWVPQNPHLFHDTLASNLRLAKPEASDEQLAAAVRLAHLDEFVLSLPDGFQTVVGEGGARLSAGQAQRLALARAFLKDAPILVLDEPSSNLDPQNEAWLEASTRRLMEGRTVITIAHRLGSVYRADRIVVLQEGRIVESGTHPELLARDGAYARLVRPTLGVAPVDPVPFAEKLAGEPVIHSHDIQALPRWSPRPEAGHRSPSILFRLLGFLRGSWGWVALSVLLGWLTVASNVGLMATSAYLIATAALQPSFALLQIPVVGVRFFGISRGVFRYCERLSSHSVTFRLLARLRTWFYTALEPLAPARLMQHRSGDLLSRLLGDVETLENFYVRVAAPPLVALLAAAGMLVFFLGYAPVLAWTYLAFLLLLGLGVPLLALALSREAGADLVRLRSGLYGLLVDRLRGLADLLVFGRGPQALEQLSAQGQAYAGAQRRLAALTGFQSALSVLLVNGGMVSILILGIRLVEAGLVPGVQLAVLPLAALAGFEAVMPLPLAAQTLSSSLQAARRLFELADAPPEVPEGPAAPVVISHHPALRISGLSFSYPGNPCLDLEDFNLDLPAGKMVALVGPSGAGKTTVASLALRFWEYRHGSILLDGRELRDLDPELVRRQISVVSQRTHFFDDTIGANLRLARPEAGDAELRVAVQRAQLGDFIQGLPGGFETFVSERGLRLSAGERQRLALARAFLKDAPILLLDEPTANLDPPSERRILESIFAGSRDRSLLLITHRLVGLETMDEILVLERGRVVERGVHASLLKMGGFYARMYDLQNRFLAEFG